MDFFERQDRAHRHTKVLVVYFALAVALIVLAIYLVFDLALAGGSHRLHRYAYDAAPVLLLWNPRLFLWVALGTLAVITVGSASKTMELSRGGSAVAEMLGGEPINPNTTDPDERKLLNVVEEMAIASGTPVPQIYLLPDESINAFAAGHSTSDTVIAVTGGAMKLLSRDELQGVIGHEFSHILNGDMRLNVRLIGMVFGIMALAIIGRVLLQTRGSSRDRNPLPLLGLALLLIGWIGVFFGRLIQSAISRQREYLADASSVQFTRNPAGLSGALQKIGGLAAGSRLESSHADVASHMFFANGMGESLFGLMETHPPLAERIRAIDPAWDGKFPDVTPPEIETPGESTPLTAKPPRRPAIFPGFPGIQPAAAGLAPPALNTGNFLPHLGNPASAHLQYAANWRASLPPSLEAAAREPLGASAIIYALLLGPDDAARKTQLEQLATCVPPAAIQETVRLLPDAARVAAHAKLPLVDFALPGLRGLSPSQFEQFTSAIQLLVEADAQIDLFEYVLQKIVLRHLEPRFRAARKPTVQYYALKPLLPDCSVLLSALAQIGQDEPEQINAAFSLGWQQLHGPEFPSDAVPAGACNLDKVDAALNRLTQAVPQIKKNLLNACAATVAADGVIKEAEAELLRAIADTLDCPIPPFVEGIQPR